IGVAAGYAVPSSLLSAPTRRSSDLIRTSGPRPVSCQWRVKEDTTRPIPPRSPAPPGLTIQTLGFVTVSAEAPAQPVAARSLALAARAFSADALPVEPGRAAEVGAQEIGSPGSGAGEVRLPQVGPEQPRPAQVGAAKRRADGVRACEVRFGEIRLVQLSFAKIGGDELGPVRIGAGKIGTPEIRPLKGGVPKIGDRDVHLRKVASVEVTAAPLHAGCRNIGALRPGDGGNRAQQGARKGERQTQGHLLRRRSSPITRPTFAGTGSVACAARTSSRRASSSSGIGAERRMLMSM